MPTSPRPNWGHTETLENAEAAFTWWDVALDLALPAVVLSQCLFRWTADRDFGDPSRGGHGRGSSHPPARNLAAGQLRNSAT